MPGFRFPSLFWTFTGSFLLVLILAVALQAAIMVAVLRPMTKRTLRGEAADMIQEVSRDLAEVEGTDKEIADVLRAVYTEHRAVDRGAPTLVFEAEDGLRIPSRRRPSNQVSPPGRLDETDRERRGTELMRETVSTGGGRRGDLVAHVSNWRLPMLPLRRQSRAYLFFPVSVFIAGIAGLVLFRRVTGRIRNLEALAERVAEGDLEMRVAGHGKDEIGRLGEALNRMTERLAAARDKEEAVEQQRRRLLADISHELATPLTSIRGYAETLLNPEVPVSEEERTDYLENVLEESKRMDLLVADILELARLESGGIELGLEKLDWASLSSNTVERFMTRYREVGLTLTWQSSFESAWVMADGRRLEQVLENLLANSLRYVPRGGAVALSMTRSEDSSRLRLTVIDNGPGIPLEQLPHIFDRFYRADPARLSGGTGLGLAIVKEIVIRHGGSVRAEPAAPSGLTILVELPEVAPPNP